MTPEAATFLPVVGARDISIGLLILTLSLQGHRKAVGTVLGVHAVVSGGIDIWTCLNIGGPRSRYNHAGASGITAVLAWVLFRS